MKRFYTHAAISDAPPHGILLDGKPVRTPARLPLALDSRNLAEAIAGEWAAQGETILPRSMPLTGLANAAIDRVAPDPSAFAVRLAAFAGSELLAYRADGPASLVARQTDQWDPWLAWAAQRDDAHFSLVVGILHKPQAPESLARITAAYGAFCPLQLAALDPVVTITGSAVLGLAVAAGEMDADTAYALGHLDAIWQEEYWGRDPLAEAAEAERRADLAAAVRFLRLL
ncbi:ATP12 family protein [Sandarakinorhabdus sp.]|uniref:ATP12 family chaperone protein n=1 Tax=Sandarakinorhabdus sp. TaxID=1916663 RepID=UPI00286D7428|nr:ATP12 family protein [Sandarakinorhabdus sp.]